MLRRVWEMEKPKNLHAMTHGHELMWGLPEGMEGTRWRSGKGEKLGQL